LDQFTDYGELEGVYATENSEDVMAPVKYLFHGSSIEFKGAIGCKNMEDKGYLRTTGKISQKC
jgi:hypothetical protein